MNIYEMGAAELSRRLAAKELSSEEVTSGLFDRIDAVEDKVEAYITLTKEEALKHAKAVDEKRTKGEKLPAAAGIPIAIKDNICTKNVLTTCASKMLYNFAPPYNATVMDKIESQDCIMLGKLNMDEFAMGSSCETSYFKKTKNPYDITRVPGGSSGGSAAAVAALETPFALGSDTGGSIRQPAGLCGVVGLKPTYGTVSRFGLIAFASSLDQIGPLARSVRDAAMLFDIIKGHDWHDSTSEEKDLGLTEKALSADIKGKKIGLPKEFYGEGIKPEIKEKVLAAAHHFESLGAQIVDVSIPISEYALPAYYIISSAEASSNLARFDGVKYGFRAENYDDLIDLYFKTRSEGFGDEVKRRILLGTYVLSSGYYDAYYKKACQVRALIKQGYNDALSKCDALLTPVTPTTAFKIGEKTDDPMEMYMEDICTVSINIAGLPALVQPCGEVEGLPVGMQLIGRKFGEQTLLDLGYAYETTGGAVFTAPKL
ncbi:MAG: Asp-tRNA(Asn)/Glu-tRNA(Gln) amidotransferase subunit GatA [Bacillota bacterium]|nr:Asp-tRNA(Asn)/Glu-tRNA(Gln) amidotransferase subunit GatA [Bacillota bacterium]